MTPGPGDDAFKNIHYEREKLERIKDVYIPPIQILLEMTAAVWQIL